jgi:hypothetical protein
MRGISMTLCLGRPDNPQAFGLFHPDALVFKAPGIEKAICFDWGTKATGQAVILSRSGNYDGPPPDWCDWEKR